MISEHRVWRAWPLLAAGLGVCVMAVLAGFGEASLVALAHAPILLTRRHFSELTAPTLLDGRVSFALYGMLEEPNDVRYARVVLPEDDELMIEALVPDLAPENTLGQQSLPVIDVVSPTSKVTELRPNQSTPFYEEFTHTSFITYVSDRRKSPAGTYLLRISGAAPCRFVIAVGYDEDRLWEAPAQLFGAGMAANEELETWYRVPPPPESAVGASSWKADATAASHTH